MSAPHAWIRHPAPDRCELFFPFDAELVEQFKQLIPWQHRRWVDSDQGKCWVIEGPLWCAKAEAWFELNCGRGKEIAKGQMEMVL